LGGGFGSLLLFGGNDLNESRAEREERQKVGLAEYDKQMKSHLDRKEVELARAPTAEELKSWYEEHDIKPDADGKFDDLPYGPTPVEKSKIVDQVRENAQRRDVKNLTFPPFGFNPKTMVFVCGGPTLASHLDELREKSLDPAYEVYTSNKTCMYLLENNIKPKYHVIIDPTEKKKKDLAYDCDEVTLLLGLQCNPAVFEARGNRKTFKFLAASALDRSPSDVEVAQEALTEDDPTMIGIGGGSMMGTRALYLASALGHRRIEYYGFDACTDYDPDKQTVRHYAYDKQRGENILEVVAGNGRKFYSTLAFSRQGNEIMTLMDKLPGMDVVVHGDSFMSNQVEIYKSLHPNAPYRFTPEYAALNAQMHVEKPNYGVSGHQHAQRVFMGSAQLGAKFGSCDVLDYGCGKETLRQEVERAFLVHPDIRILAYDPGRPGFDAEPEPADMVVCTDVMEHVEPECVDAVLKHIHSLTRHIAIIDVDVEPANKHLPDGRNAHICLRERDWWESFIKKYFVIIEKQTMDRSLLVVAQPIEKYRERKGI
jgi:hypothetical protein